MNNERLFVKIQRSLEILKQTLARGTDDVSISSMENNVPVVQLLSVLDKFITKKDRLMVCNMCLLINPEIMVIAKNTITDLDNMLLKQEQFYTTFKMYYIACYKCILEGEGEL